jgi:hypothetical protein
LSYNSNADDPTSIDADGDNSPSLQIDANERNLLYLFYRFFADLEIVIED